jgi:hypothetical protein
MNSSKSFALIGLNREELSYAQLFIAVLRDGPDDEMAGIVASLQEIYESRLPPAPGEEIDPRDTYEIVGTKLLRRRAPV